MLSSASYGLRSHREALVFFELLAQHTIECTAVDLVDINFPQDDQQTKYKIYRGFLYQIGDVLGFKRSKTHDISTRLYEINALTMLARPVTTRHGVWMINFTPTIEQLTTAHQEKKLTENRISPGKIDAALMEINASRARIYKLEKRFTKTDKTLDALEALIDELRSEITQLKQNGNVDSVELGDVDGRHDTGGSTSLPTL